jgi:toxin ParE1/3/4
MVQIKWMHLAIKDLQSIFDYIALDSKKFATYQVKKVQEKTSILKEHIFIGKVVPEIADENIRELIEGKYSIIYKIESEFEIKILMVYHSARLLSDRM